jgi:hypothetical protein
MCGVGVREGVLEYVSQFWALIACEKDCELLVAVVYES